MDSLFHLLAAGQPQPGAGGWPFWYTMLPLVVLMVVMLWMTSRNARRQERERQQMLSSLEKNDKVLTAGGIYGTVISVNPNENEVVVKVDDNTRLRMTKESIVRNLTKTAAASASTGTPAS
jgi:preprotein translocase subunit YajC